MYQAGAGACFDMLSVQGYGLWSGPTDQRLRQVTINYQRHLWIRDMMVKNGDAHKPIWISEAGWNPVPNDPAIANLDRYGRVTMDEAAEWAPLAYERAHQRMALDRRDQLVVLQTIRRPRDQPESVLFPAGGAGFHADAGLRVTQSVHHRRAAESDRRGAAQRARGTR